MTPNCVRCGKPTSDGPVCHRPCALSLTQELTEAAGNAEDAWTVIARQARYGAGARGGREQPLPVDLTASDRYAIAENVIGTWARHVVETRRTELPARRPTIGPLCELPHDCRHGSCDAIQRRRPPAQLTEAARWLATQTGWLRMRPEAGEAFDELHDACHVLQRLVDRPGTAGLRLVGMCDCGRILYAPHGRDVVQCKASNCGASWHVDRSQAILRAALDERLVTAAEAAHLAAWLNTDRTQQQIRKLINAWSSRGQIIAHGEIDSEPTFRFGDVAERLARTPRRSVARTCV